MLPAAIVLAVVTALTKVFTGAYAANATAWLGPGSCERVPHSLRAESSRW